MPEEYIYNALPPPGEDEDDVHIRLLILKPGLKTDEISCVLSVHPLANSPDFRAVSYSWGHPDDKTQIRCEGKLVTVPINLKDYLIRTQSRLKEKRAFWVDSICINQKDAEEKNSQVTAMRHIYKKAKWTLIWLGKEYDDSTLGLTFAEECAASYRKLVAGDKTDEKIVKRPWYRLKAYDEYQAVFDPKWAAFFNLFDRPYWGRAWVVQEVVVSSNQWICCGDKQISWTDLFYGFIYIMHAELWVFEFYGSGNVPTLMAIRMSQHEVDNHIKPIHYQILLRHRSSLATDARDRIFAYYGISAHESLNDHNIKPNYTTDTRAIYIDVAVSTLRGSKHLEFLDVPRLTRDSKLNLPSWVPNWESTPATMQTSLQALEYNSSEQTKGFAGATKDSQYTAVIDETLTRLTLYGYTVDRVAQVTNYWVVQDTSGFSSIPKQAKILQQNTAFVNEWETVLGLGFKNGPYPTGESKDEVFWQTCIAGIFPTGKDEARKAYYEYERRQFWFRIVTKLHLGSFIWIWTIVVLIGHFLRSIGVPNPQIAYRSMTTCLVNRRALVTLKGYVGLVPKIAEVGDYIVLAKGGRMPLVLRPKGKEWEFIGDCYIHGMMNGEFWDGGEGEETKCESIVLV